MSQVKLLEIAESVVAWMGGIPVVPVIGFISAVGTGIGFFLALKPLEAIELQKRFYVLINWRMEPISLPKEIRNTRLMGIFIIVFLMAALALVFSIR